MKNTLFFIFILMIVASCADDGIKEADLIGNWDIVKAERNTKSTYTLEKTFFNFLPNEKMITNLYGGNKLSEFSYKNGVLKQKGKNKTIYQISFKEDTLILNTEIRDNHFRMLFLKSELIDTLN